MAALDFPASPTGGQQYAAPNGATYQWDGVAWVVAGSLPAVPSGPAGGDLSGTYPNPTVAAAAITRAKLAIGATNSNRVGANIPASFGNVTTNQWIKVVDAPAITVRGGSGVLIYASPGGYITVNTTGGIFYMSIGRAGAPFYNLRTDVIAPPSGGGNVKMPVPPILFWDTPVAGTYTYSFWVWQGTNLLFIGSADASGQLWVEEFS